MLTAVKRQIKVAFLSIKYSIMMQMLNKVTFITNVVFMILNNASFIIQWIVLFNLKSNIGGLKFNQVLLLWGIASGVYGVAHLFFEEAFNLSKLIINGKLDSFIVQPKNVLISAITSRSRISALGDLIYGYIVLLFYGITIKRFFLFSILIICGGLICVEVAVIYNSLCFWFVKADTLADSLYISTVTFATYPETIFKSSVKLILYTIIPAGLVAYIPFKIMLIFTIKEFLILVSLIIVIGLFSLWIFNKGLKKYSSSSLMVSRI